MQLLRHMSKHQLGDELQSAYKSGHSIETALLKIHNDTQCALDKGEGMLLVMLDLSAAFDTITHDIIIDRLHVELGLNDVVLKWFISYLHQRTQSVIVNDEESMPSLLTTGVPQGSVLGPLLFLIYVLPLKRIFEQHNVLYHGYADDTQIEIRFSLRDPESIQKSLSSLEKCLCDIKSWMRKNYLQLNDSKTDFMVIAPDY
jgi:hypothetical protein